MISRVESCRRGLSKFVVCLCNISIMVNICGARTICRGLCISHKPRPRDYATIGPVITRGLRRNYRDCAFGLDCNNCILDVIGEGMNYEGLSPFKISARHIFHAYSKELTQSWTLSQ